MFFLLVVPEKTKTGSNYHNPDRGRERRKGWFEGVVTSGQRKPAVEMIPH